MSKPALAADRLIRISTSIDLGREAHERLSEHKLFAPSGSAHERTVAMHDSSFRVRDQVRHLGSVSADIVVEWSFSKIYSVVLHGHGFELFLGDRKVADLFVSATSAIHVRAANTHDGGTPLVGSQFGYQTIQIHTVANEAVLTSEWKFADFTFIDHKLIGGSESWSRFESMVGLNFLLKTSEDEIGSQFLLVGFSAIRPTGDFTYNYKASLEDIDANVLFILDDFGDQGAYYYADHGDIGIFSSVQELLAEISTELNVPAENLIFFGSSKGGAAALLHGISYGAGHVYVGAPQTKIGSFVSAPHPNVLELIMGDTSQSSIDQLDSVMFRAIDDVELLPKTTIIVGNADHHLEKHAIPLRDHAKSRGHHINLNVLRGVPHGEIGYKYREALHGYVSRVLANYRPNY